MDLMNSVHPPESIAPANDMFPGVQPDSGFAASQSQR
jgi:hypothetical protein